MSTQIVDLSGSPCGDAYLSDVHMTWGSHGMLSGHWGKCGRDGLVLDLRLRDGVAGAHGTANRVGLRRWEWTLGLLLPHGTSSLFSGHARSRRAALEQMLNIVGAASQCCVTGCSS